jgi:hypothetical protein
MLAVDPRRRPAAKQLPRALRDAFAEARRRPRAAASLSSLRERSVHAGLAAVFTAAGALVLPFFPAGWPFVLAALAGALALRSPRAGFAVALAVPVLPLGNIALGLALAYAALAAGWFALFVRRPTSGFLFLAGPLLAPLGAIGLLPLVAERAGDRLRQGATVLAATLSAGAAAALVGGLSPFGTAPAALSLEETTRPDTAVAAAAGSLGARPGLFVVAAILAAATLALPSARAHGLWGLAFWGSAFAAAMLLLPLAAGAVVSAPAILLGIWAAVAVLALPDLRKAESTEPKRPASRALPAPSA